MTFFKKVPVIIKRYGIATSDTPKVGGYWERGKWIKGQPIDSDFTIMVSVQPATGEDMQTYAEGRRVKSMYKCFSDEEVFTTDPQHAMNPSIATNRDEVLWNNEIFEVVHVEPWKNGIIPHFAWYMLREKEIDIPNTPVI